MLRNIRALPAALLVAVVLLVAVAGGATAAKLITGKQIKNGTVTTQDIKNNNLTGKDVRNGTLAGGDVKDNSLTGADVANGSVSAADLAADAKNEVRFVDGADVNLPLCTDTGLGDCFPIVGVSLSKGTWLVTATATLSNAAGVTPSELNRCGLVGNTSVFAEAQTPLAAEGSPGESETIAFTHVLTLTGGAGATLRCTEMGAENLQVDSPTITAVKIS